MEVLSTVLPIVIDILLIILITVGIILIIKCIYIVDKTKEVILNVEDKVNSLNNIFSIINVVGTRVEFLYEKVGSIVEALVSKFKHDDEDDEYEVIEKKERKRRK